MRDRQLQWMSGAVIAHALDLDAIVAGERSLREQLLPVIRQPRLFQRIDRRAEQLVASAPEQHTRDVIREDDAPGRVDHQHA